MRTHSEDCWRMPSSGYHRPRCMHNRDDAWATLVLDSVLDSYLPLAVHPLPYCYGLLLTDDPSDCRLLIVAAKEDEDCAARRPERRQDESDNTVSSARTKAAQSAHRALADSCMTRSTTRTRPLLA